MGLYVSHGAFRGASSAFNRLRKAVAKAAGGSYPPHCDTSLNPDRWYWEGNIYSQETHPGLFEFLSHSDCDGEISPKVCRHVADELEALLPMLDEMGGEEGHLARIGGYGGATRKFIEGCRAAANANEPLEFY